MLHYQYETIHSYQNYPIAYSFCCYIICHLFNLNFKVLQVFETEEKVKIKKQPKKITKQRLKNVALYYLKRFESSTDNLRQVLQRRVVDYAYYNPDWDKAEALLWIDELLDDFVAYGYLNDNRYTEIKVKNYISAGKSMRYIRAKLKQKGIKESQINDALQGSEYNQFDAVLLLAKKKRIGPFRKQEDRNDFRQKDLGILLRAGFDYDVVQDVLAYDV